MFSTNTIIFGVCAFLFVLIVQAFLSSRKSAIFGLILPVGWFIFSIYVMFHFKNFVGDHGLEGYMVWGWYGMQVFLGNVPTIILLLVFSLFRPRKNYSEDDEE